MKVPSLKWNVMDVFDQICPNDELMAICCGKLFFVATVKSLI